jgi:hypothetical protein
MVKEINNEINHIWSILCESSTIEQGTNLLSLYRVIEEITASDVMKDGRKIDIKKEVTEMNPLAISTKIDFVAFLRREIPVVDASEYETKLEWISPSGKALVESKIKFDMSSKKNVRLIFKLDKLAMTGAGTYLIRLSIKDDTKKGYRDLHETPVDVKFI